MDRYAVLGQPISHSLSPRIHALFAGESSADLSYEAVEVGPGELGSTLHRFHEEGYAGLNLTLPLKVDAVPLCATLSARAEQAGSANTLVRRDAGWHGDNTDGSGLVSDLENNLQLVLRGKRILVLGAGGAARGILGPLLEREPKDLVVAGRTPWKAEEVAARFAGHRALRPCTFLALKGDHFDLVINATSAGHSGTALKVPSGLFAPAALAYDLSYGIAADAYLAWARTEAIARTSDGLGMLVEQAADAFYAWRGVRPSTAGALSRLRSDTSRAA